MVGIGGGLLVGMECRMSFCQGQRIVVRLWGRMVCCQGHMISGS